MSCCGARSTRTPPPTRPPSRCASSGTTPAAGASTTRPATGRPSRTRAARTTAPRCRTWSPRARHPTVRTGRSKAGSAACRCSASTPGSPSSSPRDPRLALVGAAAGARDLCALDLRRDVSGHLRPADVSRPAGPRLRFEQRRQPPRPLRAERLHRHLQLRLRAPGGSASPGSCSTPRTAPSATASFRRSRFPAIRARRRGRLQLVSGTARR